jgi:hypothetical protein
LVHDLRAFLGAHRHERREHEVVHGLRAEAARHDQQAQRPLRPAKRSPGGGTAAISSRIGVPSQSTRRGFGMRLAHEVATRRSNAPPCPPTHAVGDGREDAVGDAGDRARLEHHEGTAPEHRHHPAGEGDVAAQREHHVGRMRKIASVDC